MAFDCCLVVDIGLGLMHLFTFWMIWFRWLFLQTVHLRGSLVRLVYACFSRGWLYYVASFVILLSLRLYACLGKFCDL